jgi:putative RecB family exonuclease
MLQEEADRDRQLALYGLWVKDKFSNARKVLLKWHMLAFNKEMISERTEEQFNEAQKEVMSKIVEIEQATKEGNFPVKVSTLCNYCAYRQICPSFKHQEILEAKPLPEYKKDDGLRLVDEYSEITQELKELQVRKELLQGSLIEYSKQLAANTICGTNMKVTVKETDKIILPEDKESFADMLKARGLYEEFTVLNNSRIGSKYKKGELPPDIAETIRTEKDFQVWLGKRKDIEDE